MHIVLLKCPHVQIVFLKLTSFSSLYSNCCCSCSFEPEIINIGQSYYKMYSNNILNFQEATTILNSFTKILETYWMHCVIRIYHFIIRSPEDSSIWDRKDLRNVPRLTKFISSKSQTIHIKTWTDKKAID